MLSIGLERVISEQFSFDSVRVGYLSNQSSTDRFIRHGRVLLQEKFGSRLRCLFSPQHGFWGEKQDNMIESEHCTDAVTSLPMFSLYGDHRKPTPEMFADIDLLFVDLLDVGTRVYTYIWTLVYCLEAAAEMGKKIVVLDRPNPIGGVHVEGNVLESDYRSFVGLYPIPMRHGMTVGELALLFNKEFRLNADLEVISMEGWKRAEMMRDTGFPWLPPSPNMPTPEAALVYPGQVIWEGSNVSEGRGTTMPFEYVGAPYWNPAEIIDALSETELPGCVFREVFFEPTSGKWAGHGCRGFHVYVTDRNIFRPYRTSLALLRAVLNLYPDYFLYKEPPYEYEYVKLPMDLILGDQQLRLELERGTAIDALERGWQGRLTKFMNIRENYLLYS